MYGLLHQLQGKAGRCFIHIPYLPEQVALHPGQASSVGRDGTRGALETAIAVALEQDDDVVPWRRHPLTEG